MRTADDARRDPKPGDVLNANRIKQVTSVCGELVFYRGMNANTYTCCLKDWRKWAATAEALKVAQP